MTDRTDSERADRAVEPDVPRATPPAVRVEGLWKRFGDHTAVAGIDLVLPAGKFIGLVGPNGAGEDHHALHGHRSAPPGPRPDRDRRTRRLARSGRGEVPHRSPARGPAALRAPLGARTSRLHRPVARTAGRGRGQQGQPAAGCPGPGERPAQTGHRLLDGHAQEDRARRGVAAQPRSAVPGRAVRGRRPGVGADHPRGAGALHRLGGHRRLLQSCHGARRVALRLGGRHGGGHHPRPGHPRRGPRRRVLVAERLPGTRRCRMGRDDSAALDWLGGAR